ncbi:hypothetical protein K0A97_02355 [Patescibacteria group bacterium]|nr:hypothetical protein [Patescibacteria group bacterium]
MENKENFLWVGISGSWRYNHPEIEKDVENKVREIILEGNGIITGGALGVDYFATQTVLDNLDEEAIKNQLRLYLPTNLKTYSEYLYMRANQKVVKKERVHDLVSQLNFIQKISLDCILDDWGSKEVNKDSYYARNEQIAKDCDELYAFQVNMTPGTQNTIFNALKYGKPVHILRYNLDMSSGKLSKEKQTDIEN